MIFELVLVVDNKEIQPDLVSRNHVSDFKKAGYQIHTVQGDVRRLVRSVEYLRKYDSAGAYTGTVHTTKPILDSSLLRVCSTFLGIGASILYGQNNIGFSTMDTRRFFGYRDMNLINLPASQNWVVDLRRPEKPSDFLEVNLNQTSRRRIRRAIRDMLARTHINDIQGWVLHDPCLRTLQVIGPLNCSFLTHITLRGCIKLHANLDPPVVIANSARKGDLVQQLRVNSPFFSKLCPNVRKFTIVIEKDTMLRHDRIQAMISGVPLVYMSVEQRLLPVLRDELRSVESIRVLEILDDEEEPFEPNFAQAECDYFAQLQ